MARETLTLTNEFHGTRTNVVVTDGRLTARQAKRAWSVLCGIKGCACGDDFGARGPQIDKHGQRVVICPVGPDTYEVSAVG